MVTYVNGTVLFKTTLPLVTTTEKTHCYERPRRMHLKSINVRKQMYVVELVLVELDLFQIHLVEIGCELQAQFGFHPEIYCILRK